MVAGAGGGSCEPSQPARRYGARRAAPPAPMAAPGLRREVKMRRAIARARPPRMAAKGDGFALFVAAVGIAAIAPSEIDQRKMTRLDLDAAQLDRLGVARRPARANDSGDRARSDARGSAERCPAAGLRRQRRRRPVRTRQTHSPGPADGGIAGIGGVELRVDRVWRSAEKDMPLSEIFPQRVRMLGRPVRHVPLSRSCPSRRRPTPWPIISDIPK